MQTGKEKNFDLVSTWGNIFHSANATTRIFGEKPCVMSFLNNNEGYPGLVAALQGPAGPLNGTDFAIQDLFKEPPLVAARVRKPAKYGALTLFHPAS